MGLRLPDLRPARTASADDRHELPVSRKLRFTRTLDPEPPPEPAGTFSYPSPGGDLNGDGLADVLVWEMTLPSEHVTLRALRGTDGTQLWSLPLDAADAFTYPVGDLTGDGIDDLVVEALEVIEERETEDCPSEDDCRYEYEATLAWQVSLRSGADGRSVWTRRYGGRDSYRYRYEERNLALLYDYSYEQTIESSNWLILALLSGDHNGDGANDLVVDGEDLDWHVTQEYHRTGAIIDESAEERVRTATRAQVVSGPDGRLLASLETEKANKIGIPWPVGDMVGDKAPDLLWDSAVVPDVSYSCRTIVVTSDCPDSWAGPTFELNVLDGRDLERAWRKPVEDADMAFIRSVDGDVSGDGAEDIWISTRVFDESGGASSQLRMISGADGRLLWKHAPGPEWEVPLLVAPLGGAPGSDVLTAAFGGEAASGEESEATSTIRFARVEGTSGETLFETTHRVRTLSGSHNGYLWYTQVGAMGDANGDGTDDVYVSGYAFVWDWDLVTGEPTFSQVGSSTFAESSRTGTLLHEAHGPDIFVLWPAPDLDGDGRSDAYEWHFPLEEGGSYQVRIHGLAPTNYLWDRTFTSDEFWSGTFSEAGDEDGRPGDEILYGTNFEQEGRRHALVSSLEGATGRERWRVEL